ncbi:U4/U6 small nuclear ribonucleoprotein Prp3-like [Argiope bruennichi]|uniref:U4/U6 small nuclear ribonucleoprotein Prp3-like n=1 Tax=Argiope bruennichi TaxID=94029 RepID=UPI002495503A|nr:U4/U6 small nuclear ribonucleoprotein Prp3-like [Argiope bruennichi]
MAMSKEEIRPQVDRFIQRFLGVSEPSQSLVSSAVRCLVKGYDQRKTADKLSSYLDNSKAEKLADQLFRNFSNDSDSTKRAKKRHRDEEISENKKIKTDDHSKNSVPGQPSPGQLTTIQIQEMMANAQRMIEERKKQMLMSGALGQVPPSANNLAGAGASSASDASPSLSENKARIAQLTAMIQAKLSSKPALLTNWKPDDSKQHKPAPLILDSEGRTLDMTGKEVHLTHHMPTLKANIRAQKRAQFKMSQEKVMEELYEQKFYDPRLSAKTFQRPRKGFKFHEKGKFEQLAQRLRTKAQLEKLQEEIAQAAKKTGISSATKLALIVPRKEYKEGEVPEVEWWDSYILQSDNYERYNEETKLEGVTALVEHPIQMKSPCDASQQVFIPLYLTKKERKKLRRQNRREAWKEKQEKIRLGLEPPPEPKVRMSNLMRVLGNQAVQDPTKVEAHVREQMAKRQKAHEEANAARKLTVEQKRDKKIRKLKEDTSTGVHVAVYRVLNLSNPAKKFKVEMNAKQLFMTGCVLLYRNINIVVVEGGPNQQKKFKRLMLQRIKWNEEQATKDGTEQGEKIENRCILVWEGTVVQRSFGDILFKLCPTETFAREFFKKRGVEHYWDLVYGMSILDASEDA